MHNNKTNESEAQQPQQSQPKSKKNKELTPKHLRYLFGNDYSDDLLLKLNYDYISIYSITPAEFADQITDHLEIYCKKIFNKHISKLTITEMTACIGGNVISFAKKFKYVNAIELCEERYNFLNHNLKTLNLHKNVSTIMGDSLIEVANLRQDIVFFDIPWGGKNYKFKEKINLYISKIPSYNACNLVKDYTKMVIMKIPNNFNLDKFEKFVEMQIYDVIDLNKFKLLILI